MSCDLKLDGRVEPGHGELGLKILGILNITEDSFSDGGKFIATDTAIAHGENLLADGADILDIGAVSSNPDSKPVPSETEIARLASVIPAFLAKGATLSIDTFSPDVQRWALTQPIAYLNDIHGFADPALYPALAAAPVKLIVMHAVLEGAVATRADVPPAEIIGRITAFFDARIAALTGAGITRERLILDPGMGFFLGSDPGTSLEVLRGLPGLKARYGLPLLVSMSRKSFLRRLTGRPAGEAGPASLAAELYAEAAGADYIRTHAPGPLRDGLKVLKALGDRR